MSDIYDQHQAAFSNVSAFVVLKDGERVATVALKFPRDGAGRLYAYVHWLGVEMVRGHAGGYGYDKRSAAIASAVRKQAIGRTVAEMRGETAKDDEPNHRAFLAALATDGGEYWDRKLHDAGFDVLQAV